MKRFAIAVLAASAAFTAHGQAIYRCGQTYSQIPCPGGKIIDSSDPRSAAQRAEAKRAEAKEKQLAAKLERERQAKEAQAAASQAGTLAPRPEPATASEPERPRPKHKPKAKPKKAKAASGPDFVAVVPPTTKADHKEAPSRPKLP